MGGGARAAADNVTAFLRPACEADLNQIVQIERASFADPWTEESFRRLLGGHPAIFQVIGYPADTGIAGYVIAFSVGEDAELLVAHQTIYHDAAHPSRVVLAIIPAGSKPCEDSGTTASH